MPDPIALTYLWIAKELKKIRHEMDSGLLQRVSHHLLIIPSVESVQFVPFLKMCVKWMKLAPIAIQNVEFLTGMNELEKHVPLLSDLFSKDPIVNRAILDFFYQFVQVKPTLSPQILNAIIPYFQLLRTVNGVSERYFTATQSLGVTEFVLEPLERQFVFDKQSLRRWIFIMIHVILNDSKLIETEFWSVELVNFLKDMNVKHYLFRLFGEDDQQLIDLLLLLLHVFNQQETNPQFQSFSPIPLFYAFLETISFDTSLIIDYLISNETQFLEYFLKILKLMDYSQLNVHEKQKLESFLSDIYHLLNKYEKRFSYSIQPLIKRLSLMIG